MPISLYWMGGNRDEVNFGDTLSPKIVEMMSGKPVRWAAPEMCDLTALGSILDKVAQKRWKRLAHLRFDRVRVWGSGAFGVEALPRSLFAPVAVRGPLTAQALGLPVGMPLGDPGLLVDRFGTRAQKAHRWGIIPHVTDRAVPQIRALLDANPKALFIDLGDPDVMAVLRKIQSCDFIISTSLHGIITADAFGIPNIWMTVGDNVFGADWKFADYFSALGRATTVLELDAPVDLATLEVRAGCADMTIIDRRRAGLEKAFRDMGL